jgi:hypothetical protein
MKRLITLFLIAVLSVNLALLGGCANGRANNAQTYALYGGIGGAVIGAATGGLGGAALGGCIGAGGGYIIGNEEEK